MNYVMDCHVSDMYASLFTYIFSGVDTDTSQIGDIPHR